VADFGEIKAQIKRDLVRDSELSSDGNATLDDDTIEHYVKSAIAFYSTMPLYFNEATATLTTVASQSTLGTSEGFPTDFIADIALVHVGEAYVVPKVGFDFLLNLEQSSVVSTSPSTQYYTSFNSELRLFPQPDSIFTLTFYYTKELTVLSDDTDTNSWTTDGERLIRSRAMGDIYAYRLQDTARASTMYQIADVELSQLQSRDTGRNSSGQLTVYGML